MALLVGVLASTRAFALGEAPRAGETVTQYLTPAILQAVFPGADRIGAVAGTPPAAPVYRNGQQIGYLFSTWDVTQSRGYSDRPWVLLIGLSLTGRITGLKLVHHTEPINALEVYDQAFFRFTQQFVGVDIKEGVDIVKRRTSPTLGQTIESQRRLPGQSAAAKVDAVSRATVTSMLMSDAIIRGARMVARSRGIAIDVNSGAAHPDVDHFAPADWPALEATGAISHLRITYGDLRAKLPGPGLANIAGATPSAGPEQAFLDLYVALLTPASIGVNILGRHRYDEYTAGRGIDDQIVLIAINSPYSVLGQDWETADTLGSLELIQGDRTIRLSGKRIKTLRFLRTGRTPDLTERAVVFLRKELDPTQPWQARVLVTGATRNGQQRFASFDLSYQVPERYLVKTAGFRGAVADSGLDWRSIWQAHIVKIAVLGAALAALSGIFLLQDRISRRRRLHWWIRVGFLSWTLLWLGWYAGAQLTVLYLLTLIHAAFTGFRWAYVLADPLVAILSVFTLAGLLLWGRAVFCGWLCPFGALQELANKAARQFRVRQIRISPALHRRLIVVKYFLFFGLVAASFFSWDLAMKGAEVEPFKAAIILRFATEWPMMVYALGLVGLSLFVERFYCRFACPLGAGLAIIGRVHVLDQLKRRPECGSPCRVCETVCPVGAIKRSGEIDMNECFYCLDCQVTYYDDHTCPPLVWQRKHSKPAAAMSARRRTASRPVLKV